MPRSIVVGNGNVLVGYDAGYSIRDLYFPRVGGDNHTMGNLCRTGIFVDGRFSWLGDAAWRAELGYAPDTLVSRATLTHPGLGVELRFLDFVDMTRNLFIRDFQVIAAAGASIVRVFFHYDWYIGGSDIGNTVLYDPGHRALVAYKEGDFFLLGGQSGAEPGISTWATGKKGGGAAGTWVDAEDGSLSKNPIEQGSVDCTLGLDLSPLPPGEARSATHWVCMGSSFQEVARFGQELILERGVDTYRDRTLTYWAVWSEKDHRHMEEQLGLPVCGLYRRSVLTARSHVDNRGAVIAATDYDITKFARDTYAYVWPRDGALVANALDRAGHEDITRKFYTFCRGLLGGGGYFLHKYTPDGHPGSSWHPWLDSGGQPVLPIQEDETGLVLWALWEHYRIHRNLDFVVDLYSALVRPAAAWMADYIDESTGLVKPSWDLWEERWGVHAFTVGAVHGGLKAAAAFAELFGDPRGEAFALAAHRLKEAADTHLYRPELSRFARRLTLNGDGSVAVDPVLDSAIYGLWRFGMYEPDDDRIVQTMTAIRDQLSNRGKSGGQARYTNDYYFQIDRDLSRVPGNPWFICTLWLAQWYIATARKSDDLEAAGRIIEWVVAHQQAGGLLSEQVDPHSGAPLSVSPLTWSHAEFVITVDDFLHKAGILKRRRLPPRARRPSRVRAREVPPKPESATPGERTG